MYSETGSVAQTCVYLRPFAASPWRALMSLSSIEAAFAQIGCPHDVFEMTMSLLGLVVIGELRLSNR